MVLAKWWSTAYTQYVQTLSINFALEHRKWTGKTHFMPLHISLLFPQTTLPFFRCFKLRHKITIFTHSTLCDFRKSWRQVKRKTGTVPSGNNFIKVCWGCSTDKDAVAFGSFISIYIFGRQCHMAYASVTKKISCYRETECGQNLNHSLKIIDVCTGTEAVSGVIFPFNEKCL
jgi:hypothetical protein